MSTVSSRFVPAAALPIAGREAELARARREFRRGVAAAVMLGVAVRAAHVLSAGFPLNDGALFFAMTRDIQRAHYALPAFTSYNAAHIPFGYSPLGFYVAALLDAVTPVPLIDLFRWLPLALTSLSVVAFALLASDMLRSRRAVVAAVFAFALTPRSFLWLIMGGGLTRALGFLFAILALRELHRLYTRQRWRYAISATVFAALTALSHLGTVPFLAFSAMLFLIASPRRRFALLGSVVVAAGTLLLTAAWWSHVLILHGFAPFRAAFGTSGLILSVELIRRIVGALNHFGLGTGEPLLSLIGMLAVIGGLASLRRGRRLLPVWWVTTVLLDQRAGSTYATIPLAMLAGIAVVEVILPLLTRGGRPADAAELRDEPDGAWPSMARRRQSPPPTLHGRGLPMAVLGGFLAFATCSALLRHPNIEGELPDLGSLSRAERGAMYWVARGTPARSRFLVIAETSWEIDRTGEWFPVLAERVSVATVQGTEWLPNRTFRRKEREYNAVQGCGGWLSSCLDDWSRATGNGFTHVYVPRIAGRECCRVLLYSLAHDPRYELIYDGPGAQVFANRAAVAALTGGTAKRPSRYTGRSGRQPRAGGVAPVRGVVEAR